MNIYMKISKGFKFLEANSTNLIACTQSSYNDLHGDGRNPYTCDTIALVYIY